MFGPTSDHGEILAWATRNGAVPAERIPLVFDGEPAVLHFLFGKSRSGVEGIRPIQWDAFFAQFDLLGLLIVFDDSPTFQILQDEKASEPLQTAKPD